MTARRLDPLGVQTPMPFRGRYYPLGFPLDITTNSRDVMQAAAEAWPDQTPEFEIEPLVMRVVVDPQGPLAQEGRHRKQGPLYTVVCDPYNSAAIDLDAQFAFLQVSQATAADHSWLRWFFVESLAYLMLCQRHIVMAHAGCVSRHGSGVLLCGPSTAGKSTLSYAAARAGWTWIADDCVCVLPESTTRVVIGRSRQARFRPDAPRLFPELEAFVPRTRPTGKIGIEVTMAELPGIAVDTRTSIDAVVFLERREGRASMQRLDGDEAIELLLSDMPSYGPEVDVLHEAVVRRLAQAPAYRLTYASLEDGVRLLSTL